MGLFSKPKTPKPPPVAPLPPQLDTAEDEITKKLAVNSQRRRIAGLSGKTTLTSGLGLVTGANTKKATLG